MTKAFVAAVAEMRRHQKLYFKLGRGTPEKTAALVASLAAEKRVDAMLDAFGPVMQEGNHG